MPQDACFVRFLGHVTGRAGLAQLAGTFVADPRRNFTVNQSVRAQVVQVIFLLGHQASASLYLAVPYSEGENHPFCDV